MYHNNLIKRLLITFLICSFCISIQKITYAQTDTLTEGNKFEKYLHKGEIHSYFIHLNKGEYAGCVINQNGVDAAIDLISPGTGKKLRTFDSPNGNFGPENIEILANETGYYQLRVYPMIDLSIQDSSYLKTYTELNQGNYTINQIQKLSSTAYQLKLEKEKLEKNDFIKLLTSNAKDLQSCDAGNSTSDLQPLKQILKNVTVIGLGEASHGTSEFFRMKHRLLEFLVKEMGITGFYLEASMARCRYINDYVLTGKGNLDTATAIQGFTTWRVEEFRNMIKWIREYNLTVAKDKKVQFQGFDLQGNDVSWKELKEFYTIVKPSLTTYIDSLFKEYNRAARLSNGSQSQQLEGSKIFNTLHHACKNILNDLSLIEGSYIYATNQFIYKQNLMNIKLIIQEIDSYKDGFNDRRDYYMAQNILSLLTHEKTGAKVVVWAHNDHIRKLEDQQFGTMGYYLNQSLKNNYYAMGFEFYSGSFQSRNLDINNKSKSWDIITIGAPKEESLPTYLYSSGKNILLLNFKNQLIQNNPLFKQPILMHSFGSGYSPKYGRELNPDFLGNFDGLIYIKYSTAAKNFTKVMLD